MGNRIRNTRILESLARSFELTIVTLVFDRAHLSKPGRVAELGTWVPVFAEHKRSEVARAYWHLRAAWSGVREGIWRETFFQSLPGLSREVERQLDRVRPDVVHAAYWYSLRRLRSRPRPPLWVVDTHDVQFERQRRLFHRESPRERSAEIAELARYDRVIAITEEDRRSFASVLPHPERLEVIPMGLDLAHWAPEGVELALPEAPRLLFYGNLSTPVNREAAEHLVRDIMPLLPPPQPELLLLGADPAEELRTLAKGAVARAHVPGFVSDVRPWLRSGSVFALSLRKGSGQRGRVLEALALGVPVVAYPEAILGLELRDGEGILLVDSTESFARALTHLLGDVEAAKALGERGRQVVADRYSWDATYGRFPRLYQTWLSEMPRG